MAFRCITEWANNSLTAAVADLGCTDPACILIDATATISGNTTVTGNIELWFIKGGMVNTGSPTSFNLTINGYINAGHFQIFDGNGTITIDWADDLGADQEYVSAAWFPDVDVGDKINKAIGAVPDDFEVPVVVPPRVWAEQVYSQSIVVNKNLTIRFPGNGLLPTKFMGESCAIRVSAARSKLVGGFYIDMDENEHDDVDGLYISATDTVVEDARIDNAVRNGIVLTSTVNDCYGNTIRGARINSPGGDYIRIYKGEGPHGKPNRNSIFNLVCGGGTTYPEKSVTLTCSSGTVTATAMAHGYLAGDVVQISGADQTAYNGVYIIRTASTNTFTYKIEGTSVGPATGTIKARRHQVCLNIFDGYGTGIYNAYFQSNVNNVWGAASNEFNPSTFVNTFVDPVAGDDVMHGYLADGGVIRIVGGRNNADGTCYREVNGGAIPRDDGVYDEPHNIQPKRIFMQNVSKELIESNTRPSIHSSGISGEPEPFDKIGNLIFEGLSGSSSTTRTGYYFCTNDGSGFGWRFRIASSGVGRFTKNLIIDGNLSKGSGQFRIEHPLDRGKLLYHSFIEGPRYDLLYRGQVRLVEGKASVDLDKVSRMTPGTFIALTRDPQVYLQNASGFSRVRGWVDGVVLNIVAEDTSTDTINWMVVAERQDSHIRGLSIVDAEGRLVPEQVKVEEEEE